MRSRPEDNLNFPDRTDRPPSSRVRISGDGSSYRNAPANHTGATRRPSADSRATRMGNDTPNRTRQDVRQAANTERLRPSSNRSVTRPLDRMAHDTRPDASRARAEAAEARRRNGQAPRASQNDRYRQSAPSYRTESQRANARPSDPVRSADRFAGNTRPTWESQRRMRLEADRRRAEEEQYRTQRRPEEPTREARRGDASAAAGSRRPAAGGNRAARAVGAAHAAPASSHAAIAEQKPAQEAAAPKKNRYIPSLDGMRTLAVLAVIAYHMGFPWASGGLLGVTMFFVLSGYLITSLLIAEYERSRTIDLPHFWLRRVRRLVPAIVTVVIVCAALFTIFNHALLTKMRPDILPSLLFFNNWWQIIQDVSYFDALGSPSPLTHFWSLAIEEQFYLVWPPLLLIAFKLGAKHKVIRRGILALIVASVVAMALLYGGPQSDPSRVYYGTDTRAFSLLIGAWLAFAWPSAKLGVSHAHNLGRRGLAIMDIIGVVALVGLVAMLVVCDGMSPFMYHGGILLASVLTALVIAVIAHPDSKLAKVFALPPLVWIGVRSYGIYLWHYPILLLMIPVSSTTETPWWLYLMALAVIIAVSAVSFTFVEDPIRKGAFGRMAGEVAQRVATYGELIRSHIPQLVCTVAALAIAVGGIIFVPPTNALEGADILKEAEEQQSDPTKANVVAPVDETYTVLLIGDSVSVRAIPYFDQTFPGGHIDSAVNRQLYSGAEVYAYYRDANVVGDVVVFALGTNGQATDEQIDELVNAVGADKNIYFVNTRSTTSWMEATNNTLWNATQRYDNVHLVDWYSYSANRGDLFDGDGTHLTESGAQEYITLIQSTIANTTGLPEEPTPEELAEREERKAAAQQAKDTATAAIPNIVNAAKSLLVHAVPSTIE